MKNTSENNSNNDIKTKLSDITVRLLEESKEVANLQDYKGELFDLKTYSVVLTDGNYLINGQIEEGVPAIYIFYSSNGLQYVDLTFNAIQYAAKTNANFKDEENKKHFVYLGKSLDVKSRIEEHLESEDKSPYSFASISKLCPLLIKSISLAQKPPDEIELFNTHFVLVKLLTDIILLL